MQENYQNMVMSKKKRGPYSASAMAEKKPARVKVLVSEWGTCFFFAFKKIGSRIQYNILPKH